MSGRLFVVATPIGNLEDITYRAVRVLREAGVIACEDTRQSRKLLDHYAIDRPMVSYHEHNEAERAAELVKRMLAGESVAVISDAGMPLISDPGYRLVHAAVEAGIAVEPVPGPSAVMAALAGSGLPTDAFRFCGFLPAKPGQRKHFLEALLGEELTLIFFEAPHRILETLEDLNQLMPERPVVVARELTKVHEEFLRGTAAELREELERRDLIRGEITVLVGKGTRVAEVSASLDEDVDALVRAGLPKMDAIKAVAKRRGLSKREVYDALIDR
jgi:16S rRNA (cytidine1402-2'-O)-methyltransferase